ncbi:MAG: FHA domain-containing protein [Planctomycetales bacterium]
MATMSAMARITIISGPDRGKVFEVREELVQIGAGDGNDVPLSDPELADHRVRIVSRNGRYAISTTVADTVEVDGNVLPPERWVWLPETARVRMGGRTSFQFAMRPGGASEALGEPAAVAALGDTDAQVETATPSPLRKARGGERPRRTRKAGKADEAGGRQVARFITGQKGDALVKLGEDGQLPELSLHETAGGRKRTRDRRTSGESPWLVYAAVGVSVLFSAVLLLIDFDSSPVSNRERIDARDQIAAFRGDGAAGEALKPYQIHLRQAALERSRGNRAGELAAYQKVLDLLFAEDKHPDWGLTGSPERDRELERLIGILKSR